MKHALANYHRPQTSTLSLRLFYMGRHHTLYSPSAIYLKAPQPERAGISTAKDATCPAGHLVNQQPVLEAVLVECELLLQGQWDLVHNVDEIIQRLNGYQRNSQMHIQ